MHVAVAGDVAGAAGAGADREQRLLHRRQHRRVLAHAEIVVRAPHRHLGADPVIIGTREAAAAPLEIGKHTVPPLAAQHIKAQLKEAFVVHRGSQHRQGGCAVSWFTALSGSGLAPATLRRARYGPGIGQVPCSLTVSLNVSPSEGKVLVVPSIDFRNTSRSACCCAVSWAAMVWPPAAGNVCSGNTSSSVCAWPRCR